MLCYLCDYKLPNIDFSVYKDHILKEHKEFSFVISQLESMPYVLTPSPYGKEVQDQMNFLRSNFDIVANQRTKNLRRLVYQEFKDIDLIKEGNIIVDRGSDKYIPEVLKFPKYDLIKSRLVDKKIFGESIDSLAVVREINTRDIIFDSTSRLSCETCRNFGRKRFCPPTCGSIESNKEKLITKYPYAYLFLFHSDGTVAFARKERWLKEYAEAKHGGVPPPKFARGLIGIDRAETNFIQRWLPNVANVIRKNGYKTYTSISGSCSLCHNARERCVMPPGRCKFPTTGGSSPEALGIDCVRLCYSVGFPIQQPCLDFVSRVSVIFTDKQMEIDKQVVKENVINW
jgi:predicted metal-binding protein